MKSPIGANIKIETIFKIIPFQTNPFQTMAELSIPVATLVGAEMTKHSSICESIKSLRDNYREFCEDEDEFVETLVPIEQDPEPYADGTKKTRPILKKYAQALLDKIILDQQLEAEAEAQRDSHLTPQQVKADMKHYVSICEKKIAKQQEQCDALQKQVEQLMDVVSLIATPTRGKMSLLTRAMIMNLPSVETLLLNSSMNCMHTYDIIFASSTSSVEKLLSWGANIDITLIITLNITGPISCRNLKIQRPIIKFSYETIKLFEVSSTCMNGNVLARLFYPRPSSQSNLDTEGDIMFDYHVSPLEMACLKSSLEMVKFLHEKGAKIGVMQYHVPNGPEGDLVAGYLQTHGSKPVTRF